jgi:hypothetical protein
MAPNMFDSSDAYRISSSIDSLSREVGRLRDEVSGVRAKLGPQPEWLFFMFPAAVIVLTVGLLIVAAAKKDQTPSSKNPQIEAQAEFPEKSS